MANNNFFLNKYKNVKNDASSDNNNQKKENNFKENKSNKNTDRLIFEKLEVKDNKDIYSLLPKKRLASIYFIVIGLDEASKFLKQFTENEVYKIINELLNIEKITEEDIVIIEKNFGKIKIENLKDFNKSKNKEFVRALLHKSFGIEKGSKIFTECIKQNESNKSSFSFLNILQPKAIAEILSKESDTVCSVVFSFMDSDLVAKVISLIPKKRVISILKNVSRKIEIKPEILEVIVSRLKQKVEHLSYNKIDNKGKEKLIEILRLSDYEKASKIISDLERTHPELANDLKENLFTFEDILQVPKKSLDFVLRELKDHDIAFILKGASKELKEKFFASLTKKRRNIINEEINFLGKVKKKDVIDKRKELVNYLRELEDEEKIVLNPDNEIYVE